MAACQRQSEPQAHVHARAWLEQQHTDAPELPVTPSLGCARPEGGPGGGPLMGPHEPLMGEATAEPLVGEHLEAWEPVSSRGRACPGWC
jgi:hypothetical protein